jgi:DDB1- and CUL4-associated factor 13
LCREKPVDAGRNFPDLGEKFKKGETLARQQHVASMMSKAAKTADIHLGSGKTEQLLWEDSATNDERDLSWSAVLKRTFEAYIRGEVPNMYGEWFEW